MVKSLNTKVDLVMKGTSFLGMAAYGKLMLGDRGFEFYDERDVTKFIQIPWSEVEVAIVSVVLGGKWIPRFALKTKKNGTYSFAAQDPKRVLREIRTHIGPKRVVRSLNFWQVVRRGFAHLFQHTTSSHPHD